LIQDGRTYENQDRNVTVASLWPINKVFVKEPCSKTFIISANVFCSRHGDDKVITNRRNGWATTFVIAVIASVSITAAASARLVTFESSCVCHNNHGKGRWSVKTDPLLPPRDANAIQAVTPSVVFSWLGPSVHLTQSSKRVAADG
jgi:hypothetical protein